MTPSRVFDACGLIKEIAIINWGPGVQVYKAKDLDELRVPRNKFPNQ